MGRGWVRDGATSLGPLPPLPVASPAMTGLVRKRGESSKNSFPKSASLLPPWPGSLGPADAGPADDEEGCGSCLSLPTPPPMACCTAAMLPLASWCSSERDSTSLTGEMDGLRGSALPGCGTDSRLSGQQTPTHCTYGSCVLNHLA